MLGRLSRRTLCPCESRSNGDDGIYPLTNDGPCVDVFALVTHVLSIWNTSPIAAVHVSGTSMAAPIAAGIAAVWKKQWPNAVDKPPSW
jgi:hypothetical protein